MMHRLHVTVSFICLYTISLGDGYTNRIVFSVLLFLHLDSNWFDV